jgi:hypothetical protein
MLDYKKYYKFEELCEFKCPRCKSGKLSAIEKDISKKTSAEYEYYKSVNGGDAEFYEARFAVVFQCSNQNCKESISCIGTQAVTEEYSQEDNGEFDVEYVDIFKPLLFDPPIHILPLSLAYPEFIKKNLIDSFRVFWVDPSACGNRIRVTLETMLTHFKIPRVNHRKKTPINLHQRIELFKKAYAKYEQYGDHLIAIKWLGNVASHEELSHDEITKAYEILEYILEEIFLKRAEKIKKMTKVINKSKGKKTSMEKPPF